MHISKTKAALAVLLPLLGAGCVHRGDVTETGIVQAYSDCSPVAIPAPTGDITLFNPPTSRDASAIDVVAAITNLRSTCDDTGDHVVTRLNFDVVGQRHDNHGARDVVLPYFTAVVQGNANVVAKRVNRVALHFADGSYRASTSGVSTAQVLRSAATLPEDIRREVTRDRRPGEQAAAIDPLSLPNIRAAVTRAHFDVFVGFELDPDQLRYNATR